jgi:hypothetical protein
MPDFANQTKSDQANVGPKSHHDILFQPGQPGPISISSTRPSSLLKSLAETGHLELYRPGSTAPAAARLGVAGSSVLDLDFAATTADLAVKGDWTCRVFNDGTDSAVYSTTITFVGDLPIKTASFDIALLNVMLSEVAATAAVRVHLESSGDTSARSVASWSVPVANLLGGSVETRFHIDNTQHTVGIDGHGLHPTFQLLGLNSVPGFPTLFLQTNPLALVLDFRFDTEGSVLKSSELLVPDIELSAFAISATVSFAGEIVPTCDVVATVNDLGIDESDTVSTAVVSAITAKFAALGLTPALVRQKIDIFFIDLLRLNATSGNPGKFLILPAFAQVLSYQVQGSSLVVSYISVPQQLVLKNS